MRNASKLSRTKIAQRKRKYAKRSFSSRVVVENSVEDGIRFLDGANLGTRYASSEVRSNVIDNTSLLDTTEHDA